MGCSCGVEMFTIKVFLNALKVPIPHLKLGAESISDVIFSKKLRFRVLLLYFYTFREYPKMGVSVRKRNVLANLDKSKLRKPIACVAYT